MTRSSSRLRILAHASAASIGRRHPRPLALGHAGRQVLPGSTGHHVVETLVWTAVVIAVFAPLAVARYRRA